MSETDAGGKNDPSSGTGVLPSATDSKQGSFSPSPYAFPTPTIPIYGSPIAGSPVVTDMIKLGPWQIYSKDGNLYASNGISNLQFAMFNPGGLQQTEAPNKLSDGSDGSGGASSGNTAATLRNESVTVDSTGLSSGGATSETATSQPASGGTSDIVGQVTSLTSLSSNVQDTAAQTLFGAVTNSCKSTPCPPSQIAEALSQLKPGGLSALVLDLTNVTKDLKQITDKISLLLPGLPYSATATVMKEFAEGFKGLTEGIDSITKELTGPLDTIKQEIGCVAQDLTSIGSSVSGVVSSLSPDQFIKVLPPNLSVDSLMTDSATNPSAITAKLTPSQPGSNGISGVVAVPASTTATPAPSSTEVISTSVPETVTETFTTGQDAAEQFIGRPLSQAEWRCLISTVYAIACTDAIEQAWAAGTVLNRSRLLALSVVDIVSQPGSFTQLDFEKFRHGADVDSEYSIISSIAEHINSVAKNNYYFDQFINNEYKKRNGIVGTLVGQSLVYPGAIWP